MTGDYVLDIPEGYRPGDFNVEHILEKGKQMIGVFTIELAPGIEFWVRINGYKSKARIVVDDDNVSASNKRLINPRHEIWKFGTPHEVAYYAADVAMSYMVPF